MELKDLYLSVVGVLEELPVLSQDRKYILEAVQVLQLVLAISSVSDFTMATFVALLFVGALGVHGFLFARFVAQVEKTESLSSNQLEEMRQLLFSGSGGAAGQFRALKYLLGRQYSNLDQTTCRAGDYALASFYLTLVMLIVWGASAMYASY